MKILILTEESDASTLDVINWIEFLGHSAIRVNREDKIKNISLKIIKNSFSIKLISGAEVIELNEIDSVWYRRGEIQINCQVELFKNDADADFYNSVKKHLYHEEGNSLEVFINSYLQYSKPHIGHYGSGQFNKLIALQKAIQAGLEVPNTCVTTQKNNLQDFFFDQKMDCISKGIQDVLSFGKENKGYSFCTSKVEENDIDNMNTDFFPSLLQANISKKYEVRIFYLNEKLYSMAIFSQNDEKTEVDFRNYNWEKPNRFVPYILPKSIEKKVNRFMKLMNLNSGSIDMIVDTLGKYIFLEVNPKGQYGMVTIPCGYNLDYEIAKELIGNGK